MSFNTVTFWSEFPEKVNWKLFSSLIDFNCSVYVLCKNRSNFNKWKLKIKSKYIDLGAWPALSFKEGYWFSGLSSKESIDKLKEFQGLKIKLDLEPPIRMESYSDVVALAYGVEFFLFRQYPRNNYLHKVIYDLSKNTDIIASGYPFPDFVTKRYGGDIRINSKIRKNYFIYTSYFPDPFKSLLNVYYKWFIRKRIEEEGNKAMFALGCIGHGVYGNERIYKNVEEFRKDLGMFNELGVKNLIVFEVAGIMERKNPKKWIDAIKQYLK